MARNDDAGRVRRDLAFLVSRSSTYAVSDVLRQAINFLLLPVFTAYLSATEYGKLSVALAALAVLEVVYGLALRGAIGRLAFDVPDDARWRELLGTVAGFLMGYGVLLTALLFAVGPVVWSWLGVGSLAFFPHIALVLVIALLNNLAQSVVLPLYYVRGQAGRYAAFSLTQFGLLTVGSLAFVVALDQGAAGALRGRALAAGIMLVPAGWVLARNAAPVVRWDVLRQALAYSVPLAPHMVFLWALHYADRVILGNLVSLKAVGVYAVGYQFGMAVAIAINGINNAWTPWFFRCHTTGETRQPRVLLTYYVVATAGLTLGVVLVAREGVRIMAAGAYHAAWAVVPLVALGYFLNGLALRMLDVLLLHKQTRVVPLTSLAAVAASVGFNVVMIPRVGMIGAAYGTVVGYGVRLVLTWAFARQTGSLAVAWSVVGRVLSAAVIVGAAGVAITVENVWLGLALKAGLWLLYPALLLVFGVFSREEGAALRGWLKRREGDVRDVR